MRITTRIREPVGPGRDRYEPVLVMAEESKIEVIRRSLELPRLLVRAFTPVRFDHWACVYGTNGTPRDRMRHETRLRGERPPTHSYRRIA